MTHTELWEHIHVSTRLIHVRVRNSYRSYVEVATQARMYTHRDSGAHSHLNTKIPKLSECTLEHKRHGIYPEMPRAQAFHIASSRPPAPSPQPGVPPSPHSSSRVSLTSNSTHNLFRSGAKTDPNAYQKGRKAGRRQELGVLSKASHSSMGSCSGCERLLAPSSCSEDKILTRCSSQCGSQKEGEGPRLRLREGGAVQVGEGSQEREDHQTRAPKTPHQVETDKRLQHT